MQQIQYDNYGTPKVLHTTDVIKPTIKPGHILIKSAFTAVNTSDARIRGANFPKGFGLISKLIFGITKPRNKVLGGSFSGIVEQVADDVTEYKPGDRVCGMTGLRQGCYSEYILKKTSYCLAKVPDDIELDSACAILFGGTTALYFLRDITKLNKGEKILINGASGSVGSAMVEIAKNIGAEVTGVCSSKNHKLISELGADQAVDYKKTKVENLDQKYDVIVDTVGNLTFDSIKNILTNKGKLVIIIGTIMQQIQSGIGTKGDKKMLSGTAPEKSEDVRELLSMIQSGTLKPVISKIYSYKEIQQAHEIVDSGRKVGNILIKW